MEKLFNISQNADHDYLFKSKVIKAEKINNGYKTFISNAKGELESVTSKWVINACGLQSDLIAKKINKDMPTPNLSFSKGCYFKLKSKWRNHFNHLVYPLPDKINKSLGIHLTIDKNGDPKLGPSASMMKNRIEDYTVNANLTNQFYNEASKYIIGLQKSDLSPDFAGIRPKIKTNNKGFSDFYISHEINNGYRGWINLIGIESPGLTSAIAIGEQIKEWIIKG